MSAVNVTLQPNFSLKMTQLHNLLLLSIYLA